MKYNLTDQQLREIEDNLTLQGWGIPPAFRNLTGGNPGIGIHSEGEIDGKLKSITLFVKSSKGQAVSATAGDYEDALVDLYKNCTGTNPPNVP